MKNTKVEFTKGVTGKIVEKIVFEGRDGACFLEVRFKDRTSMHFESRPSVTVEPELWNWNCERMLKRYPARTTGV